MSEPTIQESKAGRWIGLTLLLLAGALFVAGFIRASADTVDDAYISFRVVKNFLEGGGLSFNPGTRVESFSNPLMIMLLIPLMAAGIAPELASLVIGVVSFLFCVVASWFLVRKSGADESLAWGASACVLGCFPLLYYSVTGLETGLMAALIVAFAWRFSSRAELDLVGAILLAAIAWCRPEGIAYLFAVLPMLFLLGRKPKNVELAFWGGVLAVCILGFIARKLYYGSWLPNTFTAKPPGTADLDPGNSRVWASLSYVGLFVGHMGIALPLLALCQRLSGDKRHILLPLAATTACGIAFGFYTGGDWFPGGRYLLPIVPTLAILAAVGAQNVASLTDGNIKPAALAAFLVLTLLGGSGVMLFQFQKQRNQFPFHVMNTADIREAALWIRDNSPADAKIAAFRIGALGYYGERHIIDLHGLADREIALAISRNPKYQPSIQLGNDVPEIREYLRGLRPHAVLAVNKPNLANPPALPFYGYNYTLGKVFPQGADQTWLLYVYTPDAAPVRESP